MKQKIAGSVLIFSLIIINNCSGQKASNLNGLMGRWQVVKWIPLVRTGIVSPTETSYNKQENLQCRKGVVVINNRGIHIKPSNVCDFDEFEGLIKLDSIVYLKVVPESNSSKQYPGLEVDSGVISTTLTKLLGFKEHRLKMAVTNCDIDWGSLGKLRVFFLSPNSIAFFRGGDMLVLKRII